MLVIYLCLLRSINDILLYLKTNLFCCEWRQVIGLKKVNIINFSKKDGFRKEEVLLKARPLLQIVLTFKV